MATTFIVGFHWWHTLPSPEKALALMLSEIYENISLPHFRIYCQQDDTERQRYFRSAPARRALHFSQNKNAASSCATKSRCHYFDASIWYWLFLFRFPTIIVILLIDFTHWLFILRGFTDDVSSIITLAAATHLPPPATTGHIFRLRAFHYRAIFRGFIAFICRAGFSYEPHTSFYPFTFFHYYIRYLGYESIWVSGFFRLLLYFIFSLPLSISFRLPLYLYLPLFHIMMLYVII